MTKLQVKEKAEKLLEAICGIMLTGIVFCLGSLLVLMLWTLLKGEN